MNKKPVIVGFGNLVTDFIFLKKGRDFELLGADGGGSVFNILSHLSKTYQFECEALGFVGNDNAGKIALDSLEDLGVNTEKVQKLKNIKARRIHVVIPTDQIFLFDDSVTSSMKCPKSGKVYWHNLPQRITEIPENHLAAIGVLIIDSTNKKSLQLASQARDLGWKVIADVGHISHLRYQTVETLKHYLSKLDIVQFNGKVVDFLLKKLGYISSMPDSSIEQILDMFALELGKELLIVTKGEKGGVIYAQNGRLKYFYDSLAKVSLIDPTGAGDAFFSSVLNDYLKDNKSVSSVEGLKTVVESSLSYVKSVLNKYGARGVLHDLYEVNYAEFCSNDIDKEQSPTPPKKPIRITDRNIKSLVTRILRASTEEVQKNFNDFYGNLSGTGAIIGTGGSYPVAIFVSRLLSKDLQLLTKALKPFEAVNSDLSNYDFVLAFSYSGSTQDIVEVHKAVSTFPETDFYLITKAQKGDLMDKYNFRPNDQIISYSSSLKNSKERGFLSFAGTLTPISLFLRSSSTQIDDFQKWKNWIASRFLYWKEFFDDGRITQQIEVLTENGNCEIFSDLWTETAAIDLESKFTESGIIRPMIHDKKDFSHGRFVLSFNNPKTFFIIFNSMVYIKYNNELLSYLRHQFGDLNVLELKTDEPDHFGEFDLLIAVQLLVKRLGKSLGKDITKPSYPTKALKLYRYSGGLS